MNGLIEKYLESCLSLNSELKKKISILRMRGYSLEITEDSSLNANSFVWEKDKEELLSLFQLPLECMIEKCMQRMEQKIFLFVSVKEENGDTILEVKRYTDQRLKLLD